MGNSLEISVFHIPFWGKLRKLYPHSPHVFPQKMGKNVRKSLIFIGFSQKGAFCFPQVVENAVGSFSTFPLFFLDNFF